MNNKRLKCKKTGFRLFQSVDKIQVLFLRRLRRICVFSLTRAAKKHLVSEKPPIQRFFKGAGVVLAGIECSPKIFDFRANVIPVQERVEKVDTLKIAAGLRQLFYIGRFYYLFLNQADGENAIIIGKISSLPKSIAKDKIYFAKSE